VLSYTYTGLTNGTQYSFYVRAVYSTASATSSATVQIAGYYNTVSGEPLSSAAAITSFNIPNQESSSIGSYSVSIIMPIDTVLTSLTPAIEVSPGATIIPASGVAQNFSSPVTYTVTAQDGKTTQVYTVSVTDALNPAKEITSFTIPNQVGSSTIGTNTISLTMPYGTGLTSLTPAITVSQDATISPASGVAQNFTNPVTYTVTAQDRSTQAYTVTVTDALDSAKDISYFTMPNQIGNTTIGTNTISLTMPYGTDLTNLTPAITIPSDATISPASGVAQNFTNPVIYTVTAQDNSTQTYTVTVTTALNPAKSITSFTLAGAAGTINESAGTIAVTVPFGTTLTSLTPAINTTGVSVSPTGAQNFSSPVTYTVTAADTTTKTYTVTVSVAPGPPDTPYNVSAAAGNAQATVTFTPPSNNNGSAVTSYTVYTTPSAGGTAITATGSSSPITVSGLTNGTQYSVTVTATNAAGEGSASSPAATVTPSPFLWRRKA